MYLELGVKVYSIGVATGESDTKLRRHMWKVGILAQCIPWWL
jgi:hypothetical protein